MTTNTKESGFEELIIGALVHENGYEHGTKKRSRVIICISLRPAL